MVSFVRNMQTSPNFARLYSQFFSPITTLDCGSKCAPYNEGGVPFCCDTRHLVPTAYDEEWNYLQQNTDLWHLWQADTPKEQLRLQKQLPSGQVLIECLGHLHCQREYRSVTCRSFPFFPYINSDAEFIGLTTYWEFEDRCWVISHLDAVTPQYRMEFVYFYDRLFENYPEELSVFSYHSRRMRSYFQRNHRAIILFHRNHNYYKISPKNERFRKITRSQLPKYGNYKLSALLPFPDEV